MVCVSVSHCNVSISSKVAVSIMDGYSNYISSKLSNGAFHSSRIFLDLEQIHFWLEILVHYQKYILEELKFSASFEYFFFTF